MRRKIERTVAAAPRKRGGVSSLDIVSWIREGTLTRRQFDAWHLQRRGPVKGFVVAMRDTDTLSPKRAARLRHKKG